MIKKNIAYILFRVLWIIFLAANIADFRLNREIDLIPFIHVSEIPLIKFLPFLLLAVFVIPFKEILILFREKKNFYTFMFIALLLVIGYVSSYLSDYPETAFGVCNRIAYYFAVLIFVLASARYFNNAKEFILKSFVYSGVLIIAGSLLDFYVPAFHDLLVKHFDRPQTFHSVVKLGGVVIMRPMGFLTDSNLTAFSLSISLMLLLLNYKHFSKIFRYFYYALGSYCLGMLASRASMVIIAICTVFFFYKNIAGKREIAWFIAAFVVFQLLTPQTYYRLYTLFDKKQHRMEFSTGRFLLWETAVTVFKENPVIGAGPGVFFELSDTYIRKSIIEKNNVNINDPEEADYFKIDKKNPHNIFLVMLTETGLTGFAVFIFLISYLAYVFKKQKKSISLLFLINILIVSSVSNFAPYYKFYLLICIVFFVLSGSNIRIKTELDKDVQEY